MSENERWNKLRWILLYIVLFFGFNYGFNYGLTILHPITFFTICSILIISLVLYATSSYANPKMKTRQGRSAEEE